MKDQMMTKETKSDEVIVFNVFIAEPSTKRSIVNFNNSLTAEENALVQKHCDILTGYRSIVNYDNSLTPETNASLQKIHDVLTGYEPLINSGKNSGKKRPKNR
jgi:hypothetical protein